MNYSNLNLTDVNHPIVQHVVRKLTGTSKSNTEKVHNFFMFIRDEIKFAFPLEGDFVSAADIIKTKKGQCNNKGTLFYTLCKAAGIPVRMHFSAIDKVIQRGLFKGLFYEMLPQQLSHSWIEVQLDGKWIAIDSYINDFDYYVAGKKKLQDNGWKTGFSISCEKEESSADLNLETEKFVQMDAVTEDHGLWTSPELYYQSDCYHNRPSILKLAIYKILIRRVNRRIKKIRQSMLKSIA
ncbi:hypothetical protein NEF87_001034 [Candidatus Lokiarchaeum ossiferum]|uniref:Transglutaminase-like domain-containing protein n=1 Tax=Candidatus Lokiarchaeum ossiferum TaxID=2951803 RepID=A0ABY6HQA0_9ARCH|nr:hypothetical protein NEF87_001034 [Candidatus Lokiarchaeum sp. B-35]